MFLLCGVALLNLSGASAVASDSNNSSVANATDVVAPTVTAVNPSSSAVNVPKDKAITVTFSEPVKLGNGWIELQSSNGTLVPISKSVNNNTLSITPNVALNPGTRYAILIHTGSVTDSDGNKVAGYVSRFTTSSDAIAPVVKSVNPSNGAVNVPKDKAITVTFSEPVKLGNGWIELQSSNGTLVPISKSVNNNTLSITPLSALIQGMKYTLLIHTGSVTDLAGNKVAGYVTRFTTASPVMTFTPAQILDASARVKAYVDLHHGLPTYVTIGSTNISMAKFLQMMSIEVLQIKNGTNNPIPYVNVNAPTNPSGNVHSGNIYTTEYLSLAQQLKTIASGTAPNYISSSLGNIQFDSAVYMYSRILNYYVVNAILPNYARISHPVYITSDNIYNTATDTSHINQIINGLAALGVSAVEYGIGPNTHDSVLQSSSVPQNAVVVDIYGGACAGTIYEMGTSWYQGIKGTRDVFTVFWSTSRDITNLAWLPRAHDDDFSPESFRGLAHPDQYMFSNGYRYIYSGNIQAIVNSIYKETLF